MPTYPVALDPVLRACVETERWWIETMSRGGAQALDGRRQFVVAPSHAWRARIAFQVQSDAEILAAQALAAELDGQAGTVLLGPVDLRGVPWPLDAYGRQQNPDYLRRVATMGLYTPAYVPPATDTLVAATVRATAGTLGGTTLGIRMDKGGPLAKGMRFSVGNWMHQITEITAVSAPDGSGRITYTVSFRPALRAAVALASVVNFTSPATTMRLVSDEEGQVEKTPTPFSQVTFEFREAV